MTARTRPALLATALAVVVSLVPVAQASATPTWLPAGAVAPPSASGEVGAVDVDASGNAVAVWVQDAQVVASSRPAGGPWSAPAALSAPGAPAVHPQVALEGGGRATAVWFRGTGPGTYGLQSSSRAVSGAWTAAVDLPGATTAAAEASLALRPGSTAVVAWPRMVSGSWTMSAAIRTTAGVWGAPTDLASGSAIMPGNPRMQVDGAGTTTVVWSGNDGGRWSVRTASAALNGTWGATLTISPTDQDAVDPDLAVTGDGYAVAVWARWNGVDRWVAQASTRTVRQGPWVGPVDLSAPGFWAGGVRIATNGFGGRFVAAWTATPASGPSVVQATSREAGPWRPAATLADGAAPTVVVGDTTPTTVTWLGTSGTAHVVRSAVLPSAATAFEPATSLSGADRDAGPPRLALSQAGDVLVLWGETGPAGFQARYAAYDVAGPTLRKLRRPGRVVAGAPVSYQATVVDAWSSVATYSWSFGDGSTATGPTVTHTYAEPGRYTLRFRVTDAAGNSTASVTRTKVVTGPAITAFALAKKRITLADKARITLTLTMAAKVKLVLKSKGKHRVHGALRRQKLVLRRDLRAGRSTVLVKASRLLVDTWVVTGTARALGVDSATVKKVLVVTGRDGG